MSELSKENLLKRKTGTSIIDTHFMDNNQKLVQKIMGECVIVRAEWLCGRDGIEYTEISEHFDTMPIGAIPPEYRVFIHGKESNLFRSKGCINE